MRDVAGTAFAGSAGLGIQAQQDTTGQRNVHALDGAVERGRIHVNDAEYPTGILRARAERLD